jgi:uncharacterized lipoprotein YddW (UPF0748 family)
LHRGRRLWLEGNAMFFEKKRDCRLVYKMNEFLSPVFKGVGGIVFSAFLAMGAMPLTGCGNFSPTPQSSSEVAAQGQPSKVPSLEAWLSDTGGRLRSESLLVQTLDHAAVLGIRKLYVTVWTKGCTLFPSAVMQEYGAQAQCEGVSFDFVGVLKKSAAQRNIEVVPWFEWGLHVPASSDLFYKGNLPALAPEQFHAVTTRRLNPFDPKVETLFRRMLEEAQFLFSADEVHVCDNHAVSANSLQQMNRTSDDFGRFFEGMVSGVRSRGTRVSLSQHPLERAKRDFGVSWDKYLSQGFVQSVSVQVYHFREAHRNANLANRWFNNLQGLNFEALSKGILRGGVDGLGLYAGPKRDWSIKELRDQIETSQRLGVTPILFELGTLLDVQKVTNSDQASALRIKLLGQNSLANVLDNGPEEKVIPKRPDGQKMCEYMKLVNAPKGGAPLYRSSERGAVVGYAGDSSVSKSPVLIYRRQTVRNSSGKIMMEVMVQTGTMASKRFVWVEAQYAAERKSVGPCVP